MGCAEVARVPKIVVDYEALLCVCQEEDCQKSTAKEGLSRGDAGRDPLFFIHYFGSPQRQASDSTSCDRARQLSLHKPAGCICVYR